MPPSDAATITFLRHCCSRNALAEKEKKLSAKYSPMLCKVGADLSRHTCMYSICYVRVEEKTQCNDVQRQAKLHYRQW